MSKGRGLLISKRTPVDGDYLGEPSLIPVVWDVKLETLGHGVQIVVWIG